MTLEMKSADLNITGGATIKNGVTNSEYTVSVGNDELFRISEIDYRDGDKPNGTIHITPSADFLKGFGSGLGLDEVESSAMVLANPKLELKFENAKGSGKTEINVLAGGEVLVGVTISYEQINAETITIPQNAYGTEQAETWLSEMDINKLMEKLQEAGVPVEVLLQQPTYD